MNTEETQKVLKFTKIALIVLTVFLAFQALASLKSLRNIEPAYNSITVNGKAEVVSLPDVASLNFSVTTQANTVALAQGQVTETMNKILDELKKMGIEEKDIKTTDYSVWPNYTYEPVVCSANFCPPGRQTQDGYTATHSILLKIRKTDDAGKILTLVGDFGATNVSGITFTVDDPDKLVEEARSKAIADAREKAKNLSRDLGVRLVRVVSFYDNMGGGPMPYYAEGKGGMDMAVSSIAPTIPTGENKFEVNVTVTYEIR